MNAIIRYPGSKWSIANWIIDHFPVGYEKMVYLEPFMGSGAVFFNKNPSVVETINDLNDDIINLFRVLRERPAELAQMIELTPYSRAEYDLSFEPCTDPVEKARRYVVRTTQAIGAKADGKCGWRNHKKPQAGGTALKWQNVHSQVTPTADRLRGSSGNLVQIEHMNALRLIQRYDSSDVFMYLDPPYVRSTRRHRSKLYAHEMANAEHTELLELISQSKAKIIISGYESELYDTMLAGWQKDSTMSHTTSSEMAIETIWMNYEPPERQIEIW